MSKPPIKSIRVLPRTFVGLCKLFPLRPVHGDADLDRATRMIDAMAGHRLNRDQEDYLEALSSLASVYEESRYSRDLSHVTPVDALRFLVEQNGLTASALGELLGNRSLGSKILRGERELSKDHISVLAGRFCVSPSLFLRSKKAGKRAA